MVNNEPKDMSEIDMDEWAKMGNHSSGGHHYLHLYLIRGIKGEAREKIEPFAPFPAISDFCDVIHLMVKAPNVVQVSQNGFSFREPEGYDLTGEPNPPVFIEYSGIKADLSANYNTNSRIPESVRVQYSKEVCDMPVAYYDEDPYWWLPVAHGVNNIHTGNAALSIGLDGTPSIDLYEEKSGDWLCNIKTRRNGKTYKGYFYMSKNSSSEKPIKTATTANIDELVSELTLYVQGIEQQ